jgi:hypothetical protein
MAELHAPGWVAAALRRGMSAAAALREYREAGGAMRDSVWRKLYAEQREAISHIGDEMTAPLTSIPQGSEIIPMTTKRKSGYLQTGDVYVRLVGTDTVVTKAFMLTGSQLLSRGDALTKALTQMQTAVDQDRYAEVVLGGVYTGTRLMTPGETS